MLTIYRGILFAQHCTGLITYIPSVNSQELNEKDITTATLQIRKWTYTS